MAPGISSVSKGRFSADSLANGLYYLNIWATGFENMAFLPLLLLTQFD